MIPEVASARQRVAAYNVCLDDQDRLLLCRLTAITGRPGAWTLPGGGLDFGEHPEAGALRELYEETGLMGRIVELLEVDSIRRTLHAGGIDVDYHGIRIVYRTAVDHAELVHEANGSTDLACWFTREEIAPLELVEMGELGVRLAFG